MSMTLALSAPLRSSFTGMQIRPACRMHGRLSLPGDKSISHRAAIIASLARGRSLIENFSTSHDCASTLSCLAQLGMRLERSGARVSVEGGGLDGLRAPSELLDCGNSGSTMRMLAGVLAGQDFVSELTGDASLLKRPMRRIIEPLEMMGARVESSDGYAPLRITGLSPLRPISYRMPVASAQVKSCILLAGLFADGPTAVIEDAGLTRDHTERLLRWFGVPIETHATSNEATQTIRVEGLQPFQARDVVVPGDISSAAFFMAAAASLPESDLEIVDLGLNRTRTEIIKTLRALGADLSVVERGEQSGEEVGDVHVRCTKEFIPKRTSESASVLRGAAIARLIDELPVLAVFGTQVEGGLEIREARELRIKETDRIHATVENLRAMGAEVEEFEDGLAVAGPVRLRGAKLQSYGDHRIAMAFTIAALVAEGDSDLGGADCVAVSFPGFHEALESVVQR